MSDNLINQKNGSENSMKRSRHGDSMRIRILEYVTAYIKEHRYSPSFREIAVGVGLKSTASVHSHIQLMLYDGMLETDAVNGTARALRVPDKIQDMVLCQDLVQVKMRFSPS